MSKQLINEYYNQYDRAIQFGKSKNEQSIRNYFWILLNSYAHKQNYELVTEVSTQGTKGAKVRPDGILKNLFGLDNGLWESKDEKDTIDDEIDAKRKKGYPFNNILFEDSNVAVLFQRGEEVMRAKVRDADELHKILTAFVTFKSETVYKFETALENFKADIPSIVKTLRDRIDETSEKNKNFKAASNSFLELCKAEINPKITLADVREMMIQHILTADIFNKIFDDPEFHRHNNIARELEKLNEILFTHTERRNLLGEIEHYYDTINACASGITDHHEKQKFLKVLYENFYKVYNPKAADRLGVVYTPNEIVNFMIESTNYLLEKHFGKNLGDKNVDILDPATGTGTFISSIIDSIPKQNLAHKYQHELHANEVAILPYYIANLNIEFTYKQKMGTYEEFKNLCFVDTLDNTASLAYSGKQHSLFGLSSENAQRIKNQNSKKISVVIGNPPYNANQANENENNKNREYDYIDKRIKDTYIKYSTAQKTKVYDMYARFYRWASDRLDKNGVLAFITNRSFIDSRTFDGFRKIVASEFNEIHIVDLGGDVRANPKISGTKNNVFGIQTGVAIMFLVRREGLIKELDSKKELKDWKEEHNMVREAVAVYGGKEHHSTQGCRIFYIRRPEMDTKEEKLEFLRSNKLKDLSFENIYPDKNNNWVDTDDEYDAFMPLSGKATKGSVGNDKALFKLYCWGNSSNRDEWVYDINKKSLEDKSKFFITTLNKLKSKGDLSFPSIVKWSSDLKSKFKNYKNIKFDDKKIVVANWRPFTKHYFFSEKAINDRLTEHHYSIFGDDLLKLNPTIVITSHPQVDFSAHSVNQITDAGYGSRASQLFPLYRYDQNGKRIENITDWGLEQFTNHYKDKKIKKEDVFNYTYAVLHNPAYRKKYELNLKREFPRLPFYKDFWKWAVWGKQLMDLHINYEKAKPFKLKRNNLIFEPSLSKQEIAALEKAKLKADKENSSIQLDAITSLSGIPKEAWDYKLGNRSALEWILDQYKEKKPGDPTIAEKFNTNRFADYKEQVIDLLQRVCTVSVETMKVVREMEKASPEGA